ncbi:MAG: PilZ domain-containing protein [Rhizobiales bacterium]|nr:PilZ domain-containing protein [Hyphomicrobiales bacterium]
MMWNPEDPTEQRRHRRLSSQVPAKLRFDGGAWMCLICNISPKGAGLEPAIPSALGRMVELHSDRLGQPLLGRVVNVADNRTNVAFELDAGMQYELAKFLATNLDLN